MVVKILIFNLFFILISLSTVSSGKTIFGKAKVIDGDTIHINKNKIRLHAIDAPETNIEEEEEAKRDKKGIWIGDFEEPYLFRKKNK